MNRTITVYFVGNSVEESLNGDWFDNPDDAEEYRKDNGYRAVFSFNAKIDPNYAVNMTALAGE